MSDRSVSDCLIALLETRGVSPQPHHELGGEQGGDGRLER